MIGPNDVQYGGDHYKSAEYQPWDFVEDLEMSFLEGSVIKYLHRYPDKGTPRLDLSKARHFTEKIIERYGSACWHTVGPRYRYLGPYTRYPDSIQLEIDMNVVSSINRFCDQIHFSVARDAVALLCNWQNLDDLNGVRGRISYILQQHEK